MAYNIRSNFQVDVERRLKRLHAKLDAADLQEFIEEALDTYSRDRPDTGVDDITGDGGADYVLANELTGWSDGFSRIFEKEGIEYPYDATDAEPQYVDEDDWVVYEDVTSGKVLRFLYDTPAATETVRVHFTKPYVFSSDQVTVPAEDYRAIVNLAASYAAEAISAALVDTGDSTLQADAVNYRSKPREAMDLAKRLRERYNEHMGIVSGQVPAACVTGDMDIEYSFGSDFLTHPRRWR